MSARHDNADTFSTNTTLTAGRATAVVAFEKVTLLMTHALLGHYAELQKHWMDEDAEILIAATWLWAYAERRTRVR